MIKEKVAETCRELEYENKQLYYLSKNMYKKYRNLKNKDENDIIENEFEDEHDQDSMDFNRYESFLGDEDAYYHNNQIVDKTNPIQFDNQELL